MKRLIFILTFLNFFFVTFSQADPIFVCQYGFTFEISMQKNWGYQQPVILSVTPNASAAAAGLCVNDIIETINENPTIGQNIETIFSWLQDSGTQIQMTISNLNGSRQHRTFNKICHLNNSLSEKDLASTYSFYSLEDVQTRAFSCPFKTTVNPDCNLISYNSFDFASPKSNDPEEKTIYAAIQKNLEQKGLIYSEKNPDLIVQISHSHVPNPNFRNSPQEYKFPVESRYNVQTKSMKKLPIYYNPLIHIDKSKFFLKLNIKLIDNKQKNNSVVWECEANEHLQSDYSLANYAEFHIPLMFMQYPYPKSKETGEYYYSRSKYNYTGIHYNINNLKEVAEVDPSSPAEKAGIHAGDIIEKINGIKFNNNIKSADRNYKQFIFKTFSLRDSTTQFTNAEGFTRCMYWDKLKYPQVEEMFKKPEFSTVFSYLFYFEPYINNLTGINIVTFSIKRYKSNQKEEIKLTPVTVSEEIFQNR